MQCQMYGICLIIKTFSQMSKSLLHNGDERINKESNLFCIITIRSLYYILYMA